jgi:diguanylate cyclase (GGDEF)-like protein/PAS domain S-box-containing protein
VMSGQTREFYFEYVITTATLPSTFAVRATSFKDQADKIVVVQEDISERKRGEEWMQLAGSVFENVIEAITVTDASCNIIAVNPAFTKITGYSEAEVLGKNPRILQSGRHDRLFYEAMWQSLNEQGKWQGEIWNRGKNGAQIAEWISISSILGKDGAVERYVAVFSDITAKKKMEALLWNQANFDALTSLPNRHLFLDRLSMEIHKSTVHAQSFGMFIIDLDKFREVNESVGHHIGDMVLIDAAQRIASCLRATDTVGRLGGDEFAVLLPEVDDPIKIETLVQEILDRLAEPYIIGDDRIYLTASVGITLYPLDANMPSDLFKNADQALYVAKNTGRNRYSYFTKSMEASARARLQTLNDLRGAIEADQLKVFFQPIVDLSNNQVLKAEALLRWFHPQRGMISPAEFIPIAEESGLINEIGDWVFKESALWAQRWSKHIGQTFQISVNKSPMQFHSKSKTTSWTEYLQLLGLPGKCISVEITEGLLLNAGSGVDLQLQEYSKAGLQISIDDFGTGYSSMSYLKKFHIDYLKIDQSFVRDMENNDTDRAIAEAIIVMAHKLGYKVIAEGIETHGQRRLLLETGCDYGQGYLFSKAISPAEFESLFIYQASVERVM